MAGMDGQAPYLPTLAALGVVMQAIPGPRIVVDETEKILMVNAAASDLLRCPAADLVGHTIDILMPAGRTAQVDELRKAWAAAPTSGALGRGMNLRARRGDGTDFPIELQVVPWTTDEGAVVVVAIHDLTAAQSDTRLFRALLHAAPDAVVIVDKSGTIRLVNDAAEQGFGYGRDEILGQPLEILVPERFAGHHEHLRKGFLAAPHARPMGYAETLYAKRKDGSEFPVDISLAPVATEEGPLVIASLHDLTKRYAAIDALHKAEEGQRLLAEIDRAKDEFLATLSHELRTPLASILGFCELITEIEGLDPDAQHYMSIVTRNARREARLVEDLLTLVDIKERGLSVRAAPVDLTRLVHEAVSSAQPQATAAGIGLSLDARAGPLTAVCDPDRIGQALDSLLSNALKFTPADGSVRVMLEAGATTARIEVADTGMGIGDPDTDRVFERLYRSPIAIEHAVPGAGIGLSIAAAIVAAHHGNIRVVKTDRAGTTFAIELPLDGRPDIAIGAD